MNSLALQVARFVGPAIAGVLLASAGPTWVFGVNAVSFLGVLGALGAAAELARQDRVGELQACGGAMADGIRYVFGQRSLASLMVLMVFAGMFATPPVAFMIPGPRPLPAPRGPGDARRSSSR